MVVDNCSRDKGDELFRSNNLSSMLVGDRRPNSCEELWESRYYPKGRDARRHSTTTNMINEANFVHKQ